MTTATYLYCLVENPEPPALEGAPRGLPDAAAPRLLAVGGGLWLVAASAPLETYGPGEIEARLQDLSWVSDRALAHEALVEHFTGAGALLPMKLFTLFSSDERALADVRSRRHEVRRALARVTGRREWGVRARWDAERARVLSEAGGAARPAASGRAFLERKKRLRDAGRAPSAETTAAVESAFAALAAAAVASRRQDPVPGGAVLLDAAFLVPRDGEDAFREVAEAAARTLDGAGCELVLTGPWPPYNFAGEEAS